MKTIWRLLAIGLLIGAFILPAEAAEFRSNQESVVIHETETPTDLHLAGKNIITDAKIKGDLLIVGQTILANGEVDNSLFIAGDTVTVRSHVLRHVRIAGGTVTLSGKVEGDVYIAGGDVIIADSAEIMGGLYVASGTVTINGKIVGELKITAGSVVLEGSVGSSNIHADNIRLTSKAKVNGDFNYRSNKSASIETGAVVTGQTNYTQYQASQFDKYGFLFGTAFTLGYLLRILGAILLGWLIIRFWPRTTRQVADFAFGSPLSAIGYGLIAMLVTIFAVIVLAMSIVGIGLAGIVFVVWLLTLMIGSIIGKIMLGSWLYRLFKREAGYQLTIGTVALGVVVSALLIFVPIIGAFISFIFCLLGVGSVFNLLAHSTEAVPTNPIV
ncbi:MAG: polymer-forming cytoskeletal protein [Patescibacteria group bacterium]